MTKSISFQKFSLLSAIMLVFAMACACSNQADTKEAQKKTTEAEQQEESTDGVENKKATPCAHHAGTRSTPCSGHAHTRSTPCAHHADTRSTPCAHHSDDKEKSTPCAHHAGTRKTPCSHHARPTRPSDTE